MIFFVFLMIVFVLFSCYDIKTAAAASIPISVGTNPVGITYDSENDKIYVANAGSHTLSVISGQTNSVLRTILVGKNPYAVAYDPVDNLIYVANAGSNDTSIINGATGSVIKSIQVGVHPTSIVYNPSNNLIYVANYGSNNISVINASNKAISNITAGKNPIDLVYDSANSGVYVANAGSNSVSVINSAANRVIANISVGDNPTAIAYNAINGNIYVANKLSNTTSVIDGNTNKVIATIKMAPYPLGLAFNPNNNKIYVTHTSYKTPKGEIIPSSNSTKVIMGTIDKPVVKPVVCMQHCARPERVTINLKNNMVYITNPDTGNVSVIDGITDREIVTPKSLPFFANLAAVVDILTVAVALVLIPFSFIVAFSSYRSFSAFRERIRAILVDLYHRIKSSTSRFVKLYKDIWFKSGVILTFISLVVLPAIVVFSQVNLDEMTMFFLQNSQYEELEPERILLTSLNYGIAGFFIASILFYPPYPAPYSIQEYFKERGFKNAVFEYEYAKRILYVAVPLFIFLTTIPIIQHEVQLLLKSYLSINLRTELQQPAYKLAQGITFFIVFAGLLKIIFAITKKKFRLYFAKGCFEIVTTKKDSRDEVQKMSYVIKGLDSYNLYLRRHLNLEIKDIRAIYSKISRTDPKEELIEKISNIFKVLEDDTLEPLRYLYDYFSTKEEKKPTTADDAKKSIEEFLTPQTTFNKIKDWTAFAAIIIPLGISVIQLFIKIPK